MIRLARRKGSYAAGVSVSTAVKLAGSIRLVALEALCKEAIDIRIEAAGVERD